MNTKGIKKRTKPCELCSRDVSLSNYNKHVNSCGNSKPKTKLCPHCSKRIRNDSLHFDNCRYHPDWVNKSGAGWDEERRKAHSELMKLVVKNNPDSYSKNNVCGRVKIVEYKEGVKLKGSWEVKVAEWLDKQNIVWENEANPQSYYWNDGWKLYFPDFYLPEYDCYIEVKGYRTERDLAKWNQFKGKLLIFERKTVDTLDDIDIQYSLSTLMWQQTGPVA